jgi:biotin operon repressor
MKRKYNNINKKIHKLKKEQGFDKQQNTNTFYKLIDSLSNDTFTDEETQLVRKGLKYRIHQKRNNHI